MRPIVTVAVLAALALAGCRDKEPQPAADPTAAETSQVTLPAPPRDIIDPDAPAPGSTAAAPAPPEVKPVASDEPLRVAVAIPTGEVRGLVRPTITFSKPVRALGDREASAPAVIEPAMAGRWRWIGSATVELVPEKPAPLSTAFTVRVPAGLRALDGGVLAEEYRWQFETPRIRPLHGQPVNGWNRYRWVRPEETFMVTFDQRPRQDALAQAARLRGPQGEVAVEVLGMETVVERQARERGEAPTPNDIAADRRVEVRLKPAQPLALDTEYSLVFGTGLRSEEGPLQPVAEVAWGFRTYGPLGVEVAGCRDWHGNCAEGPLSLVFTNPVKVGDLRSALKVEPAVELNWPDDQGAESNDWILSGSFRPATAYTVTIEGLTDIFGQALPGPFTKVFRTGDHEPFLSFVNGQTLLERGHRAALPLTHVNHPGIEVGWAQLSLTEATPFVQNPWAKGEPPGMRWLRHGLTGQRNTFARSPLELDPLFTDAAAGKVGLVRLKWKEGKHERTEATVVQVTDLAVHLKTSPRDTLVWVWRLSDGGAAAGVTIDLIDGQGKVLANAATDEAGVAKLPGVDALDLPKKNQWGGQLYGPPFFIARATLGDDVAYTTSDEYTLSPYRFNAYTTWEGTPPQAEGLVFTERGIYRPGEKVYVKGILRTRSLGRLQTPAGEEVTLVATNPKGEKVLELTKTLSRYGGFDAAVPIPADSGLGTYSFQVTHAPSKLTWYADARVAEYRAPAFLVEVQPDEDSRYASEPVKATVEARYLFGAAMSGAEVEWNVTAAPGRFEPQDADGFVFGKRFNWWDDEYVSTQHVANGSVGLDGEGRAQIDAGPAETPEDRPQVYTVEAAVTDVDRQQVAGRASFPVHPAKFYVGLRGPAGFATAGEAFDVQVVARASKGEQRVVAPDVELKLVRHVWNTVKKKNAWGGFETISEKQNVEVSSCKVSVEAAAAAKCTFTAPESGYHELVAEAKDEDGRKTVTTDGLWVAGPGYAAWLQDDDHAVEVVADKGTYDVGETARFIVQSPYPEAEAWVTVERETVLWQERIRLKGTATAIEIPITEELIPNAFVGVVLARGRVDAPGKPGDPGRPSFRVGYREVRVLKSEKRLTVEVAPDSPEKRPGDELSIAVSVKDRHGKGAETEVTVWAVDEGVLSLTGYRAPDPVEALLRPRGLSVRQSTNVTGLIAQLDYGEKGRSTGGGGGAGEATSLRSRFETTPIFIGDAVTGPDGKVTVKGKLPDNLTTFRLMAVAVTDQDRAGHGQSKVVVTKPLLARPALPRAVRSGDRFAAGVVVHAKTADAPVPITVTAELEGPVEANGALVRTLTIPPRKGVEVRFGFTAGPPGMAKLRFRVEGGGNGDAVEAKVPVKAPTSAETVAVYGDTTQTAVEALLTPEGIRPDVGGLDVTLASSALTGLADDAEELVNYPYGCLEQQSSRLVPFVALKSLLDTYGKKWVGDRDPNQVVADTIKAIAAMQRPDGGFGYWPGDDRSHYWATAHAALALGEAGQVGYDVSAIDLKKARVFLREQWRTNGAGWKRYPEEQAYALYVLARQGEAQPALERELHDRRGEMALFGRALLAAAMAATPGNEGRAQTIVTELMNSARVDADAVHFAEDHGETYAPLFHSDTRTTAIVLQALLAVDPDHVFVPRVVRHLLGVRKGGGYRNTQEAAFSLLALHDYARKREPANPDFTAKVQLAAQEVLSHRFAGKDLGAVGHTVEMKDLPRDGERKLTFGVEGEGRLYYSARLRFTPEKVPESPRDDGIVVQRWYSPEGSDQQVQAVTEGALVKVNLRIASHQARHYVAIEDPLPAGLEAVDTTLATSARQPSEGEESATLDGQPISGWYSPFDHVEMRDDRVLLFADRLPPGVHTYTYMARATTAGTFTRPPARAEEMYTPEVSGRSDGGRFWVHPRAEVSQR